MTAVLQVKLHKKSQHQQARWAPSLALLQGRQAGFAEG